MDAIQVSKAFEMVAGALPAGVSAEVVQALEVLRAHAANPMPVGDLLVVRKRETEPPEVWAFERNPAEARRFFDGASAQWSDTYLCAVLAGPGVPLQGEVLPQGDADYHQRRAEEAEARLALIDTGCFNCGGLPHTETCKVRDVKALLARAERAEKEAAAEQRRFEAVTALCKDWRARLFSALTDSGFAHLGRFNPLERVRAIAREAFLENDVIQAEIATQTELLFRAHALEDDIREAINYLENPAAISTEIGKTPQGIKLLDLLAAFGNASPVPVLLACPRCGEPHEDKLDEATGIDWAKRAHRKHLCDNPECAYEWRPYRVATVGIVHPQALTQERFLALLREAVEGEKGVMNWQHRPHRHASFSPKESMAYWEGARAVRKDVLRRLGYSTVDPGERPDPGFFAAAETALEPRGEVLRFSEVQETMTALLAQNIADLREELGCVGEETAGQRINVLLNAYDFLGRLDDILCEEAAKVVGMPTFTTQEGQREKDYAAGRKTGADGVVARVLNRIITVRERASTH